MVASNYLTAVETLDLIRSGNLSVRQVAQDHITRFQQRDQTVHAWAHFDPERILREAERLDAVPKDQRGPLHGVTIGIKDMMNTKDMPTQHGSKSYRGHEPGEDAPAISVLRAAGALIIGKTHTTEFAMSHVGPPTTNPYDATRTPGGSSSGSGAAVRDFQCHLALGTQTGGSMIRPASFNGIFALKPTWGSISKEGLKVTSLLLDTLGFFARSIADLELLAKVFNLGEGLAPVEKPLRECRFLYLQTEVWGSIPDHTPELLRAWEKSKEALRAAGATVDEGQLPEEFNGISVDHNGKAGFGSTSKHQTIQQFEGKINLLAEYRNPSQRENLHKVMLAWCEDTAPGVQRGGFSKKQFLAAVDSIAALRPVFDRLAAGYDAIVTPSTKGAAPEGLENTGDPRFCTLWTILHTPVVNIPGFASDDGMPMGLSLVAPRYDDERLLSIAKAVAKVWVPINEEKLRSIPAPDGIRRLSL